MAAHHDAVRAGVESSLAKESTLLSAAKAPEHIEVRALAPEGDTDVWTLFTVGVSDISKMSAAETWVRAELCLRIPAEDAPTLEVVERTYGWAIDRMVELGARPFDLGFGYAAGDTIPNGDPPKPFTEHTEQCCWLLLPPTVVEEHFISTALGPVALLALAAIDAAEMKLKLNKSTLALCERLGMNERATRLDPHRPSVVSGRSFLSKILGR